MAQDRFQLSPQDYLREYGLTETIIDTLEASTLKEVNHSEEGSSCRTFLSCLKDGETECFIVIMVVRVDFSTPL